VNEPVELSEEPWSDLQGIDVEVNDAALPIEIGTTIPTMSITRNRCNWADVGW
jgi:hypothetical protein